MRKEVEDYIITRRNEGATLREISDEVLEKFDFKTSKQNIHKFYTRWNDRQYELAREDAKLEDIIQVAARLRYAKDCAGVEVLKDYSPFKLRTIIKDHKDAIAQEREELEGQVLDLYCEGLDIEEIGSSLGYKGVDMDARVITNMLKNRITGFSDMQEA